MKTKIRRICVAALLLLAMVVSAETVYSPTRSQGLIAPATSGHHALVTLRGPGKFVSAMIAKQGGLSDMTFVSLDIDGVNVVNASMAALKNWALTGYNPYGLVIMESGVGIKTVTISFFSPLGFRRQLILSVDVQETNVVQILANVIHGK